MPKCKKYTKLIFREIDENIKDREKAKLKAHLEICEKCKEEYKIIKNAKECFNESEPILLPDNFKSVLRQKLVEYNMSKAPSVPFYKKVPLNIAATLVLAVGITVFALNNNWSLNFKNHNETGNEIQSLTASENKISDSKSPLNSDEKAKSKARTSDSSYYTKTDNITTESKNISSQENIEIENPENKEFEVSLALTDEEVKEGFLTVIINEEINLTELFSFVEEKDGTIYVPMDKFEEVKLILKDYNITIENGNAETLSKNKFIIKKSGSV